MHPNNTDVDADVDLQTCILEHLSPCNTPTSILQRTLSDKLSVTVTLDSSQPSSEQRVLWVLHFLPGIVAANFQPINEPVLHSVGKQLAVVHGHLRQFEHPHLTREFSWQLLNTHWLIQHVNALEQLTEPLSTAVKNTIKTLTHSSLLTELHAAPTQCIHGDVNEHNVVLTKAGSVAGLLDFGDAHRAPKVVDVAIAACYFMMQSDQPLVALGQLIKAYHQHQPLNDLEQRALLPLVRLRLAQSMTHACQHLDNAALSTPDREYRLVSLKPAIKLWRALDRFREGVVLAWVQHNCGSTHYQDSWQRICKTLSKNPPAAMFEQDLSQAHQLKLHPGSGEPRDPFGSDLQDPLVALDVDAAIGGYGEPRMVYQSSAFKTGGHPTDLARTIHKTTDRSSS